MLLKADKAAGIKGENLCLHEEIISSPNGAEIFGIEIRMAEIACCLKRLAPQGEKKRISAHTRDYINACTGVNKKEGSA